MAGIHTSVKNKDLVEKRRKQIILAAIDLFSKNGFHKTSMREIASAADLSTGNIYEYISTKEDIFFLIHSYIEKKGAQLVDQSIKDIDDPREKLRRIIRAEFNMMDRWSEAIMLIYQESHILSPPLLKKLLKKERHHIERFENAIQECIEKGLLRECPPRIAANLIKTMTDTWVIKRWDLRKHTTQLEVEQTIMDMIFNGLNKDFAFPNSKITGAENLDGKNILFVNGNTILGGFASRFLSRKGARVSVYMEGPGSGYDVIDLKENEEKTLSLYSREEFGPLTHELYNRIEEENGPIDIYIHDLGAGNTNLNTPNRDNQRVGRQLDTNLKSAIEIGNHISKKMSKKLFGNIVFISPWSWDRHANQIYAEIVAAGAMALTRDLAEKNANHNVRVNCLVPGYIKSVRPSLLEKSLSKEELNGAVPMGRLGELQDVTDALLFLISDASKYVTGHEIRVNGGEKS